MLGLYGCQFLQDSPSVTKPPLPEVQKPAAGPTIFQQLTLIELLDSIHAKLQDAQSTQVQPAILEWQNGLTDAHFQFLSPEFVRQASNIVLKFLDSPASAIDSASAVTAVNAHELNALTILRTYLHTWNHDCENAIKVLTNEPIQSKADRARRLWQIIRGTCAYYPPSSDQKKDNTDEDHWRNLALMLANAHTPIEVHERYRDWQLVHPDHLAAKFAPTIVAGTQPEIEQIALLLPQTGPLANAAHTIRDGFFGAHLYADHASDVTIEVYDSTTQNISSLIERAVADGADLVVGPLDKERVSTVTNTSDYEVPVIALNRAILSNEYHPKVLQLGLAVEDDATEVVRYLHSLDRRRVVLIMGAEYWSIRAGLAFKEYAQNSLTLLDEIRLTDMREVADVVADVLHISQSSRRHQKLQSISRYDLEFVTRKREDIDAIVTFVEHDEFESLAATLHYHFGGDIPIIATETSFRGLERTSSYAEGTFFTAMPVTLHEFSFVEHLKEFYHDVDQHLALYAFGADAYRASMWSHDLREGHRIAGYTGLLQRDQRGIIRRQPIWGVINGRQTNALTKISNLSVRPKSLL